MKTKIIILFMFLSIVVYGQSNHTINLSDSGTNDFTSADERFNTTSGTTIYDYLTWDATNLYVGISGSSPAGTVTDGSRIYHVYIDTDPEGSNGTTVGEAWRWDPTLPFSADYHYAFKTQDNSETKRIYSGSWGNTTIATSNYKGSGYWELSMSRSDLGSPTSIKVLVYVEEDWDGGSICGGLPSDLFTNTSTQGAIVFNSHYHGYTLGSGYTPNDANSHDYVMRKNTKVISLDGGESFGVNDGSDKLDVSSAWTFEAWIFVESFASGNFECIMDRRTVTSFYLIPKNSVGDYAVRFVARDGSGSIIADIQSDGNSGGDTEVQMDFSTWYHVAATYDGTTAKLYINSSEADTDTDADWALTSSSNAINIGGRYWGGYERQMSDTKIDEIRVSDIARAIADMQTSTDDNGYMSDANTVLLMHLDNLDDSPSYISGAGLTGGLFDDGIVAADYVDPPSDPVPVQLTSFSASTTDAGVTLNWETATEVNNYGFEIQRATADDFETIGFVNGHGNSNSPNSYIFIDNSVAERSRSYRLKQIDTDGSFEYSNVIEVNGANLDKVVFAQNYPNPFNPSTTFSFSIPNNEFVTLAIYNSLGQKVADIASEKMNTGTYNFSWNATQMTSGVYFARLNVGAKTQIQKIMLLK